MKKNKQPEKYSAEWHQLQVAKKTLTMNPIMVEVLGGMTIEEAKKIVEKYK